MERTLLTYLGKQRCLLGKLLVWHFLWRKYLLLGLLFNSGWGLVDYLKNFSWTLLLYKQGRCIFNIFKTYLYNLRPLVLSFSFVHPATQHFFRYCSFHRENWYLLLLKSETISCFHQIGLNSVMSWIDELDGDWRRPITVKFNFMGERLLSICHCSVAVEAITNSDSLRSRTVSGLKLQWRRRRIAWKVLSHHRFLQTYESFMSRRSLEEPSPLVSVNRLLRWSFRKQQRLLICEAIVITFWPILPILDIIPKRDRLS